ncbi:MAG: hypothetical protein A2X59_08340 [Nitrospirae bacterium GWC2_42_7]|nr:MAG: hypothetical protein A2X59_08340 [Nitrospirae bacterium GWC2_42_7]
MKQSLLFMTYEDDDFDEGLSYALDLAKMMDRGIAILLVHKKKLSRKFEDLMTAITFAQANEHETARQIISGQVSEDNGTDQQNVLREKCDSSGVSTKIYNALDDTSAALNNFLKNNKGIDMVLLSPSITDNGNLSARELNQLLRTASRPIVTMAKHAHAV